MTTAPRHTVATVNARKLIRNGLALADAAHGHGPTMPVDKVGRKLGGKADGKVSGNVYTAAVLEKAAADLRHAAEMLTAERLALEGWPT